MFARREQSTSVLQPLKATSAQWQRQGCIHHQRPSNNLLSIYNSVASAVAPKANHYHRVCCAVRLTDNLAVSHCSFQMCPSPNSSQLQCRSLLSKSSSRSSSSSRLPRVRTSLPLPYLIRHCNTMQFLHDCQSSLFEPCPTALPNKLALPGYITSNTCSVGNILYACCAMIDTMSQ